MTQPDNTSYTSIPAQYGRLISTHIPCPKITLSRFLRNSEEIDFVFIDANHTYKSTLSYFKQVKPKLSDRCIVIIDDIYWSKEMTRAWNDISYQTPEAACIDIYKCGIIIFDRKISPERVKFEF